jgi:hypothetical protein
MAGNDTWQDLRRAFLRLQSDCSVNPPIVLAGRLSAIWSPEQGQWWLEAYGTRNENGIKERFALHAQAGARLLGFDGDGIEAITFWLNRVRQSAPDAYVRQFRGWPGNEQKQEFELVEGGIEILDICLISADHCLTRVGQPDLPPVQTRPTGSEVNTARAKPALDAKLQPASLPQFPKRAEWLKAKLAERKWSKHNLQHHGGPEHRTTQKILDGMKVQDDVLRKVISGLQSKAAHKEHRFPAVSESDIPNA